MKKEYPSVILLGSTGSIGRQTLELAEATGMKITALGAGRNLKLVEEQARRFRPVACAMADEAAAAELKIRLADTDINVLSGAEGVSALAFLDGDTVLNAVSGSAGLAPTLATIEAGKPLALANKESLVMAGGIVMSLAKEKSVRVAPVDSEHSAIMQTMRSGKKSEIKQLILTASGGPFFGMTKEQLKEKKLSDALAHPTWSMGKGITVDSATLMNKGFEVIEASHLFGIPGSKISVVVHRESIIHSMTEYIDNSVIAQLSVPDMRLCIAHALTCPSRKAGVTPQLDLTEIGRLTFYKPDTEVFPLLPLAYRALEAGGALPAALHAANEAAVNAFIDGKIVRFTDIQETVIRVTDELSCFSGETGLDAVFAADSEARRRVADLIKRGEFNY